MSLSHSGHVAGININSCLHARFDIAQYFYDNVRPRTDDSSTCLYKFHAQTNGNQFSATFDCPEIKFVCDHEVTLKVKIQEASYQLSKEPGVTKERSLKQGKCTVSFGIPFIHEMNGNEERYILRLDSAEYRPKKPTDSLPGWLVTYLTRNYIPTLKRADHGILCVCASLKLGVPRTASYFDYLKERTIDETSRKHVAASWISIVGPDIPDVSGFVKETRISMPIGGDDKTITLQFGPLSIRSFCKHDITVHTEIRVYQLPDKAPSSLIKRGKFTLTVAVIEDSNDQSNRAFKLDANSVHMEKIQSEAGSSEDPTFPSSFEKVLIGVIKDSIVGSTQLGSVYLVHQLFFENVVLKELERVNQQTTFVPLVHKEHIFELELWEDSKATQGGICSWNPHPSDNIEFIWNTEPDDFERGTKYYAVSSSTRNVLTILKTTKNSVKVKIDGETTMSQEIKGENKWSCVQKKTWSADVELAFTIESGMRAEIIDKIERPVETTSVLNHDDPKIKESAGKLNKRFANLRFLDDLEFSFSSVMADLPAQARELIDKRLARPAFDYDGNLLLELTAPGDYGNFVPWADSNGGSDSDSEEEHNVPKTNGK